MRHRPAFNPEAALARVASPEQAEQDQPLALAIAEILHGSNIPAMRGVVDDLEVLVRDRARAELAEVLAVLLERLRGSCAGEALARTLLGDGGESLRAAAGRIGVSHVALLRMQERTRQRLFDVTSGPIGEPD